MSIKIVGLIAVTLFSITVFTGMIGIDSNGKLSNHNQIERQKLIEKLEKKEDSFGLTLRERARLAKAKGEGEVTLPQGETATWVEFGSFNATLSHCTAVIARPIAMRTYISKDDNIATCYKFKSVEVLSEAPPSKYPFNSANIFPELLPVREDEFVLCRSGGTVEIDGVKLNAIERRFPPLVLTKKYLVFSEFSKDKKMAALCYGGTSALVINENGTMDTLNGRQNNLKSAVDAQFSNSIEQLRNAFRNRAHVEK